VWPLIILGSCYAAPGPYVVAQSVVSAVTMPLWPYSKMTDHAPSGDVSQHSRQNDRAERDSGSPAFANVALRAPLAQLAEQLTLNQRVGGSIPSRRTYSEAVSPVDGHHQISFDSNGDSNGRQSSTSVQRPIHRVCGIAQGTRHHMGVQIHGDRELRVAQHVHDHAGRHTLRQKQRRTRVP
jgi:hypothetical protein